MPDDASTDSPIAAPEPPDELARAVWRTRYRAAGETSIADTWRRVAHALALVETADRSLWRQRFQDILSDREFLPGGRVLRGAGTRRVATLLNCFVMGPLVDSDDGVSRALAETARTLRHGGGIGYDFSPLAPSGMSFGPEASGAERIAAGPLAYLALWDALGGTIRSAESRPGAMMATLRCDHPDILSFVDAKRRPGRLGHFNLSVQITDEFMRELARDGEWRLVFPAAPGDGGGETVRRPWPGTPEPVACRVVRHMPARALWDRLRHASFASGEPGVLFIDRINERNNLRDSERITATNPCGEVPLPPYGACDLGSINLARLIREPFSRAARLDADRLTRIARSAVRLLDNVIDAARFPLRRQRDTVRRSRRIGLGITGLGDALVMLGLRYDSAAARRFGADTMALIRDAAYQASSEIARDKGSFPGFARDAYLAAPFIRGLPVALRDAIARDGIRNSHLLAIAPTGAISLLAGNVSSGMEPAFAAAARRMIAAPDGTRHTVDAVDYAVALWRAHQHRADGIPPAFLRAEDVSVEAQIAMQAALQVHVDNAISKTIAIPSRAAFDAVPDVFRLAYAADLKGCTVFRSTAPRLDDAGRCRCEADPDRFHAAVADA